MQQERSQQILNQEEGTAGRKNLKEAHRLTDNPFKDFKMPVTSFLVLVLRWLSSTSIMIYL